MKMSGREAVMSMLTVAIGIGAVTFMTAGSKIQEWKKVNSGLETTQRRIDGYNKLLSSKDQWASQFADLRKMLPRYPAGKNVNIHWLSTMDRIASNSGVRIVKREAKKEKKIGDVYELPIECREWEGSLKAIKDFLVAIEKEGAMLDMRNLLIKPKGNNLLSGRFTLYCAYTRKENNTRGN